MYNGVYRPGGRVKPGKLTTKVLYDICDTERKMQFAYRNGRKVLYLESQKDLRTIAKYIQKCGLEVDMRRACEHYYLYNIVRKALDAQED